MPSHNQKVQEAVLKQCFEKKIEVTLITTNGVQLKGIITAYDAFMVVLEGKFQNAIFKSAISTIIPSKRLELKINRNNVENK